MRERIDTVHVRLAYLWEAMVDHRHPRDLMSGRRPSATYDGLQQDADLEEIKLYVMMANYGWMGAGVVAFGLMYVVYGVLYLAGGRLPALTGMGFVAGLGLGCCAGCVNCWYHMYYLVHRARRLRRAGADDAGYQEALCRVRPSHRGLKYQVVAAIATATSMLALWVW